MNTENNRTEKNPARTRAPVDVTVAQLAGFDEIIDVRSESEVAEDHIPGAINCPVRSEEHTSELQSH